MKKSEITKGTILIQKHPSKHTDKLHNIRICGIYQGYDSYKKRSYTYYTAITCEGQYYPCSNQSDFPGSILDGLVGSYNLSQLKKEYAIKK